MSSDDYYRQICVANTYYNVSGLFDSSGALISSLIYEFVPAGGDLFCNRNYPPGYMQLASTALITAINQIIASKGGADCFILRDMGKTIYAPISNATNASSAYFRMVQLVCPQPVPRLNIYNNQLGGPGGSTYGIFGAPATPDSYTNYTTFYIPVVVGGVGIAANTKAYQLAGGQM
jgi:hypothetical protein